MKPKNILFFFLLTLAILAIPLVAMQFSSDVNWGVEDFLTMGILLFGSGLIYEFFSHKLKTTQQKTMLGAGVVVVVLIIWVQLAVGIL